MRYVECPRCKRVREERGHPYVVEYVFQACASCPALTLPEWFKRYWARS